MNVYEKLNAARKEFHGLKLTKTGHNKFAGYYYFELGDFLIPALDVFAKHGLCATVSFDKDIATMVIRNVEDPNDATVIQSPMGSAALKGCHEVQNIGAVETYQRRYLWVAALEIVEHDALDATTGKEKPEKTTEQKIIDADVKPLAGAWDAMTPDEQIMLTDLANEMSVMLKRGDAEGALAHYDEAGLNTEQQAAIKTRFDSKQRSALKKAREKQTQNDPREVAAQV